MKLHNDSVFAPLYFPVQRQCLAPILLNVTNIDVSANVLLPIYVFVVCVNPDIIL